MEDAAAVASPLEGRGGGPLVFQNGVWLTRGRVDRVDKFQKWAEGQIKSEVERLDKKEHERLVKLNGQCLEVRTELRGLKKESRQFQHQRQSSSSSADGADVPPSPALLSPPAIHKSSSVGSLTSYSSGYSSMSSATSAGRRGGGGVEVDRGGEGPAGARGRSSRLLNTWNGSDVLATPVKVKIKHSARALGKLKNKLGVYS